MFNKLLAVIITMLINREAQKGMKKKKMKAKLRKMPNFLKLSKTAKKIIVADWKINMSFNFSVKNYTPCLVKIKDLSWMVFLRHTNKRKTSLQVLDMLEFVLESDHIKCFTILAVDEDEGDDGKTLSYDATIMPEVVISLNAEDEFLKNRIMNLPEEVVQAWKLTVCLSLVFFCYHIFICLGNS